MSFISSIKRATIGGVPVSNGNAYNQAVFQYLNSGSIIWMPDDPSKYIEEGYYLNPDVYAAIQTIVNLAILAPLNLYQIKPDQKKAYQKYKSLCAGVPDAENLKQRAYYKTKALEEIDTHKIIDKLNNPNEWQTGTELRSNFYGFRLATGNAYIYKSRATLGTPTVEKLYILPSQHMKMESGGIMEPVKNYIYNNNSKEEKFKAEDVIHNRSWSLDYSYPGSHLFGISPLKAARRSITMSNDGRAAQTSMLKNTGSKGILAQDPTGLTKQPDIVQLQGIKDQFNNEHRGIDNAGKVGVSVGKFEWHAIGMSSVDLSIIESQKWSQADICKCFGISPIILGDMSNSTDNNYKHARVSAITNAVIPLLRSEADSWTKGLIPDFEKNGGFVLDHDLTIFSELQEDREKQAAYLEKCYWLEPDEKRVEMGYGESKNPNMKKYYFPSNLTELDELNAPKDISNLPLNSGDY